MEDTPIPDLFQMYASGELQEARFFELLIRSIPQVSVEEIIAAFGNGPLRELFQHRLREVLEPDSGHNWRPSTETVTAIREYFEQQEQAYKSRSPTKRDLQETIQLYRSGTIGAGYLSSLLIESIPENTIDAILAALGDDLRDQFLMDLVEVSKPGWTSWIDNWCPPNESLTAIRAYFKKLGKSSVNWNK